ncbi:divalent metal cation transporter [Mammaliicoccus sciuri]|uniref:divalent metal cation transporter n=1 Tax=Mammaliicoccus sciuri TaxID=1296 RepID=UPI003979818A
MTEKRERSKFIFWSRNDYYCIICWSWYRYNHDSRWCRVWIQLTLWAVVFSIIATIALQEMVARLALVTNEGLGEAIGIFLITNYLKSSQFGSV